MNKRGTKAQGTSYEARATDETPFELLLEGDFPENGGHTIKCIRLLRDIPGRRKVYEAIWNNRPVVVKLFYDKVRGHHHLKREWKGLRLLRQRDLNCPEPLFYGKAEDGSRAIVMEKIVDSRPVIEVFLEADGLQERLDLLRRVCMELAKQHEKGIFQKDLHLGNFLISGERLFTIDPAEMKFHSSRLSKKKSISQLASLTGCLAQGQAESIEQLYKEYAAARRWDFCESDKKLLNRQLISQKRKGIRKALKKCLRTSKRYLRIRSDKYIAVFDRLFCQDTGPIDFIRRIDELMEQGKILKRGNTCFVCQLNWNNKDIVVKRYNHKGLIHSLRHTLKKSRARRVWINGHRLLMLNIATPRPLAYIEKYKGPLVWQSYIVTEFTGGQNLYEYLRDEKISERQRCETKKQLERILAVLGQNKISHGDLKQSNILMTDKGAVLTDLDAMKAHKCTFLYKIRRRKDAIMLSKNYSEESV